MKKNNGMGIIKLFFMVSFIVVVVAMCVYFTRMKYQEAKAETMKTDMLQVQWKLKDYIDKQTVKGEEKKYLGTKVSDLKDNEIIKDFLSKNVISEEEYEKYYVLQDKDLAEAGLEITNYEGSYFLINYDTYEVIDTKGYNEPNREVLYKMTDINKKDEENTTSENESTAENVEKTTENNDEKNDEK